MNKRFVILLILILTVSSLIAVKASHAAITKPSVPEFTIEFVDSSYDVPTTHTVDPYTGETSTQEGYHVAQNNVEVRIKNQPFTSFLIQDSYSSTSYSVGLYYNIRFKGHFSEEWRELYRSDECPSQNSSSEYTVIPLGLLQVPGLDIETEPTRTVIPRGGQAEFQVEAFFGHSYLESIPDHPLAIFYAFKVDETSGWSDTQTLTIEYPTSPPDTPNTSTSDTSAPDTSPPQNSTSPSSTDQSSSHNVVSSNLDLLQIAILTMLAVVAVLLTIVIFYLHKRSTKRT